MDYVKGKYKVRNIKLADQGRMKIEWGRKPYAGYDGA